MTLTDILRPILAAYRQEVQPHWSPATAHATFPSGQGTPDGQCAVTSAWLMKRLLDDHGIQSTFCAGVAYHLGDDELDHCWLEIDTGEVEIVVDLTADQIRVTTVSGLPSLMNRRVICSTLDDLFRYGIEYAPLRRLTPEQLLADPLQARLAILTEAVGR